MHFINETLNAGSILISGFLFLPLCVSIPKTLRLRGLRKVYYRRFAKKLVVN